MTSQKVLSYNLLIYLGCLCRSNCEKQIIKANGTNLVSGYELHFMKKHSSEEYGCNFSLFTLWILFRHMIYAIEMLGRPFTPQPR